MAYWYLRPATEQDIDFIYDLRIKTMKSYFEGTIGWKAGDQYKFASDYLAEASIICYEKKMIGVMKVLKHNDYIELHQIQILPEHQNNGIGKALIQSVITSSDNCNLPIKLMVLKNSPARRLYENLGFKTTKVFKYNQEMTRLSSEIL
ncbi:GNAT family N-acetyltransferase [Desulfogranum japonicum]|uniref:GNAT family N-acetyltransferase n=1 Tax=Desulfogranum japonicum TaxID=231447 RepID=UPI0006891733|nr:GNAT family N-acetyltransferase [Desulfogranum japonicum]